MTRTNLESLKAVDPRTVDRSTLVDIDTVVINRNLPKTERIKEFLRQVKNPYCYIQNGTVIKVSFSGKEKFEECMKRCIDEAM